MKILQCKVTKIILVKQNEIPIVKLLTPKYIDELRKLFQFAGATVLQDPAGNTSGITYNNGLYNTGNGKELAIESLTIEVRKIGFKLEGETQYADTLYEEIKSFITSLVEIDQERLLSPIIEVDETEMISALSFSAQQFFPQTLYSQLAENLLSKASNELINARLGSLTVALHIDYEPVDFSLIADSRININRKEFVVQVAPGYGLNDKVFLVKAPLSSTILVELLEDLEKSLRD